YSSPPGGPLSTPTVFPPSVDLRSATLGTYTTSGVWGSTVTRQKYQLRLVSRGSLLASRHVAPPSSERYSPAPVFAPISAYTRPPRPTASPMRPTGPAGRPCPPSGVQVAPPSVDLYRPLAGPSSGGYCSHGVRRA